MNLNGGVNAIRGFNYQKAVISLIAILNYQKNNFELFIENQEDAEVLINNTHTFIQIKGKKLGLADLIREKKGQKSILFKNLSKESLQESRYKIVTFESFLAKDKKELNSSGASLIFDEIYEYSVAQKENITDKLKEQGFSEAILRNKLSKSYIYFSPFSNNLNRAIPFLKGKMNDLKINVDNGKGDIALNELFKLIDQKSEILVDSEYDYNPKKKLTVEELDVIFETVDSFEVKDRVWRAIKDKFTIYKQQKIEIEGSKIIILHRSLKESVIQEIGSFNIDQDEKKLIESLYRKVQHLGNEIVLYAIIIDIVAERIQEELK